MAKKKPTKEKKKKNILKIISFAIVSIFIFIILLGGIKEYFLESEHVTLSNNQIMSAKIVVANALQAKGENISDFQVFVSEKIRRRNNDKLLEVCLSDNVTKRIYVVDINSSKIVVQAQTDYSTKDIKFKQEFDDCKKKK